MRPDIEYAIAALHQLPEDKIVLTFVPEQGYVWNPTRYALKLTEKCLGQDWEVSMWGRDGVTFETAMPRDLSVGLGLPDLITQYWWTIKFSHYEQRVYTGTKDIFVFYTLDR